MCIGTAGAVVAQGSSPLCTEDINCAIRIVRSIFVSNSDGAVAVGGNSFDMSVEDSNFTGNSASTIGGAIDLETQPSLDTWQLHANITSSTFHGNSANNQGGALHLTNKNPSRPYACNVHSSLFSENTVGEFAGALAIRQSNLSITDCGFVGNSAVWNDSDAGAVSLSAVCNAPTLQDQNGYASGQLTSSIFNCLFSIVGSNFTKNSALLTGGAVYAVLDGFIVMISQTRFEGNSLLAESATAEVDESLAARDSGGGTALALYAYTLGVGLSRFLIVSQTTFTGNTGSSTQNPQAALAMQQLACVAIQDSTFDSNSAGTVGALYIDVVDGTEDLCSGNAELLPVLPGLVQHGPPLFDPFLSKPEPDPESSAPPVPPLALTVDIRGTNFSNNTAISGSSGKSCGNLSTCSSVLISNHACCCYT